MAVDCVRLLRDYSCRLSFGAKEKKETEAAEGKPQNTTPEASFNDILDIGPGAKFGIGASAACLGTFAISADRHQKIRHWGRNFCANVARLIRFR